jgi:oligopeptide transport system permease protein
MDKNNIKDIKIDKSEFQFVQAESKIYDKKFETKPIGYFKDAMIRFSKNRTNVIASIILFSVIFLAILVPIVSTKNITGLLPELSYLPPKVPLVEKLGILDGTRTFNLQTIVYESLNEDKTSGTPVGFNPDFIKPGTLKINQTICNNRDVNCFGGENIMRIDRNSSSMAITSPEKNLNDQSMLFSLNGFGANEFIIDVLSISGGSTNVQVQVFYNDEWVNIGTFNTAGVHSFDPFASPNIPNSAIFESRLRLRITSDVTSGQAILNSITFNQFGTLVRQDSGFQLSRYAIATGQGAGTYIRQNGEMYVASFKYDSYAQALAPRQITSMPSSEFYKLTRVDGDKNKDLLPECSVSTPNPRPGFPNAYDIEGDCVIQTVLRQSSKVIINNEEFYSYNVIVDTPRYFGFSTSPYFFFGTTASGRDLFGASFLGLRTSLIIGFLAAAINISIGIVYGSISGYYGGKTDLIMERIAEIIARIPWLVTLSILVALLGSGFTTLLILLVVSGWIGVAGVTRTQFYRYKRREYVLASRTLGAKDGRLIFRHILPNGIGTIITASILMIPGVIFTESTISYLGYGIGHGQQINLFGIKFSGVSLGVLLSDGRNELLERPYLTVYPSIIISILMITFNMFGNALRDAFNPALRGTH